MTVGEYLVREIKKKVETYLNLEEEISEMESDLSGMEIKYQGNYAVVESIAAVRDLVTLYIEDENEVSWGQTITFDELLELF